MYLETCAKPSQCCKSDYFLSPSSEYAGWLGGAEQTLLGKAGQRLAALQNPFLHSPVACKLGQNQMEVPSHHRAPKLQVGSHHNCLSVYGTCLLPFQE